MEGARVVRTECTTMRLGGGGEGPMVRANHGASDLNARKQLWKRAQIQTDRDGKPRIPVQPGVKEAPDVESLVAKRRGVSAEHQQHQRETSRHRTLEKRREKQCAEEWERKVGKTRKHGKRSAEVFTKHGHHTQSTVDTHTHTLTRAHNLTGVTVRVHTTQTPHLERARNHV